MSTTINGACPGCGQTLTLEIAVRTAPRGFHTPSVKMELQPDSEEPYGTTGAGRATLNADGNGSTPSPDVRSGGNRPVCPACGLDGARLEQTAKKSGRPFTAYKCINSECDQNDEIIPGTFRWGKATATGGRGAQAAAAAAAAE